MRFFWEKMVCDAMQLPSLLTRQQC